MLDLLTKILLFLFYALSSGFGLILIKRAVTGYKPSLSLKSLESLLSTDLVLGFILYAFGFIMWMLILSRLKLNVAFPIAMSLFFIVSAFGSYFVLNEAINVRIVIGMIVCLIGIVIIATN